MALITSVQREQDLKDRENLRNLPEEQRKKKTEEIKSNLSVAERLMRRANTTTFKTMFKDDLGDIEVETRLMTSVERRKALTLNQMMVKGREDIAKYEEAIKGLTEMAVEICVTPGVDEYLQSDLVSDDVVVAMVMRSVYGTLEVVGEATTSFLKK